MKPPAFNRHSDDEVTRLTMHAGYEFRVLILEAHAGGTLARIRLDVDSWEWVRDWIDHMDQQP